MPVIASDTPHSTAIDFFSPGAPQDGPTDRRAEVHVGRTSVHAGVVAERFLLLVIDGTRKIAQAGREFWRTVVEEPLLGAGLSHAEMLAAEAEPVPESQHIGGRLVELLWNRFIQDPGVCPSPTTPGSLGFRAEQANHPPTPRRST